MKALRWYGKGDVRVESVPDPKIEDPRDVVIKVTATAICGSDLHLYDHYVMTLEKGDILGHEPMGEVVEVGSAVKNLKKGDRVVVPFVIACGECWYCQRELFAMCSVSNRNAEIQRKVMGNNTAGFFGYTHMFGGFPGGQAEYLRVPFADVGPLKIPEGIPDEKVLFLSDVFPTGYFAADIAEIEDGDTVVVWGGGPVGQFAIQSAWMLGAGRVILVERVPERIAMAEKYGRAEVINFDEEDVYDKLMELTKGRGPDRCIDAVGCEAHWRGSFDAIYDKAKVSLFLGTDRAHVLREAIMCCRPGGTISVVGVYVGFPDKIPFGAAMNKGLSFRMGQCHVQRYTRKLLQKIEAGEIDPSFVITHTPGLDEAPEMYRKFRDKEDGCVKVVLKP
ncbi:MAG TPA: zinc-dependent alcohol dehydrogenase [Thermoanaerobaculia bacterium]